MSDVVANEIKFARTIIKVDNETVSKVTSWTNTAETSEEDITGAEDYISGTTVLHEQYTPISIGETAELEGIAIENSNTGMDDGQSALKVAAKTGQIVTVERTRNTGFGDRYTGFFTNYEESADTSSVYKWSGSFRINTQEDIVPGS